MLVFKFAVIFNGAIKLTGYTLEKVAFFVTVDSNQCCVEDTDSVSYFTKKRR